MKYQKTKKTPPGKRYCKNCQNLIPIHCRICRYCDAPQYTKEQIAKEYQKRDKNYEPPECSVTEEHERKLLIKNKLVGKSEVKRSDVDPYSAVWKKQVNIVTEEGEFQLQSLEWCGDDMKLLNAGGLFCKMAWAIRKKAPYYLVISTCREIPLCGEIYNDIGYLQVWEFDENLKPSLLYIVQYTGNLVWDMKFSPSQTTSTQCIGTLAIATGDGKISIYNLPTWHYGVVITIAPLYTFHEPGLVFSAISWTSVSSIAGGTQDGSIFMYKLFPAKGQKQPNSRKIWNAHNLVIMSMDTYKTTLATCGLDGYLKLWDINKLTCIDQQCQNKRWNYSITWHPQGEFLFYDTDGVVSAHKIVKVTKNFKIDYKKLTMVSKEASLSTCFSPYSGYAYIASSEGHVSAVLLSEMYKSFKKRKSRLPEHYQLINVTLDAEKLIISKTGKNEGLVDIKQAIKQVARCESQQDIIAFATHEGIIGIRKVDTE